MDTRTFWAMIESARQQSAGSIDKQMELLLTALCELSLDDIQEFDRITWTMMFRAFRADLWEAADLAGCGCSEDGFHEFGGWLIAQGETIYESILDDPENLSDVVEKKQRLTIFDGRPTSIAAEAYELKTGQEIPESGYRERPELERDMVSDDELSAKYPRIFAKLGDCDWDELLP